MKLTTVFRFSFFISFAFILGCTPSKKQAGDEKNSNAPTETSSDAPTVGNDKDKHGCIGSAGYQWSELRGECIRLFEVGIRLDPQAADLDKTLSAFVVFKSADEDAVAEVYVSSEKQPFTLKKENKEFETTWKNDAYTLSYWKGMYSLEDSKGKLLYQGAEAK